jgi:Carbohydrate-selective porin, OprB family/S-layer homology domain
LNQNRLTLIGRVSLLCLIAGSFSGNTNPALADIPNTIDKNQPEPLAKIEDSTTEDAIANSNIDSATDTESISSTIVKLDQTDKNKYDTPVLPQTQQLDLETSKVKIEPDEQTNSNNSSLPSESNTLAQLIESNNLDSSALEQVTSVSQLSDVGPGDWAYEALRNLVERYGCIAGYPDGRFRGNRAMTRYEFAAGLNACLQQIERLLVNNPPNTNPQDLTTLRRLVDEFQVELSTLGARVDKIEGRVSSLEEHQFSTTTKLEGEAIFSLVGATGGDPDTGDNANLILVDRVRLNLKTSFTGKDLLITGLQANNFGGDAFGAGSVQGTLFPGRDAFLSEGSTKLSFEPQFPRFTPQDLSTTNGSNNVQLYKLLYIFPSGIKNLTLFGGTSAEVSDAFPTIIPFASVCHFKPCIAGIRWYFSNRFSICGWFYLGYF